MTTSDIYSIFYDSDIRRGFLHSHSYTGNPVACAAACAVLDIFEQEQLISRNQNTQRLIWEHATKLLAHFPRIRHLRQRGMILALEYHDAPANWAEQAFKIALKHHVLLRPIGNTLYCMPPYCLTEKELEILFYAIDKILRDVD
jgi:adenosylmethionine-8-amino-7-oxononanoate aminotransferase